MLQFEILHASYTFFVSPFWFWSANDFCTDYCSSKLISIHSSVENERVKEVIQNEPIDITNPDMYGLTPYYDSGCTEPDCINVNEVWIGLHRCNTNVMDLCWTDTSTRDYGTTQYALPWHPNDPNDAGGNEDCVHMWPRSNYTWNDFQCEKNMRFMCNDCVGKLNKYIHMKYDYDYNAAQDWCRSKLGTDLASIHSQSDYNEAYEWCEENGNSCWIGLNDEAQEGIYTYKDGTTFDFGSTTSGGVFPWSNVDQPEPNNLNDGEDCVEMRDNVEGFNWMWNDNACTTLNEFICNKPSELCYNSNWNFQDSLTFNGCEIDSVLKSNSIINSKKWIYDDNIWLMDYLFTISSINSGYGEAGVLIYHFNTICDYYYIGVAVDNSNNAKLFIYKYINDVKQQIYYSGNLYTYSYGTYYTLRVQLTYNQGSYIQWDVSINGQSIMFQDSSSNSYITHSKFVGLKNNDCTINAKSLYISDTPIWTFSDNLSWTQCTAAPTIHPTISPSLSPTQPPSNSPSLSPTQPPSIAPTTPPSQSPSNAPSKSPTSPPSLSPSKSPTQPPSIAPSTSPTQPPSIAPSQAPTTHPSLSPSSNPTQPPSISPSVSPTQPPSLAPSNPPSLAPSITPSLSPSNAPSTIPTQPPSLSPSIIPTQPPSIAPSIAPSISPSNAPSIAPTQPPSIAPSIAPSLAPTQPPSISPSIAPSISPSIPPTPAPTNVPSIPPTKNPTTPSPTDPGTLTCGDEETGAFNNKPITFEVATNYHGDLTFDAANSSFNITVLSATDEGNTFTETDTDNDDILTLYDIPQGIYNITMDAPHGTTGIFDLKIICKSDSPTPAPTNNPTPSPTNNPTNDPTNEPTIEPTIIPTQIPTTNPTIIPTFEPTIIPTDNPTFQPTVNPTALPSITPTKYPSKNPSVHPTTLPSITPTENPSSNPSMSPVMVTTNDENDSGYIVIIDGDNLNQQDVEDIVKDSLGTDDVTSKKNTDGSITLIVRIPNGIILDEDTVKEYIEEGLAEEGYDDIEVEVEKNDTATVSDKEGFLDKLLSDMTTFILIISVILLTIIVCILVICLIKRSKAKKRAQKNHEILTLQANNINSNGEGVKEGSSQSNDLTIPGTTNTTTGGNTNDKNYTKTIEMQTIGNGMNQNLLKTQEEKNNVNNNQYVLETPDSPPNGIVPQESYDDMDHTGDLPSDNETDEENEQMYQDDNNYDNNKYVTPGGNNNDNDNKIKNEFDGVLVTPGLQSNESTAL